MQALPHHYDVTVTAGDRTPIEITSPELNVLVSAPPREFGGPGYLWSPETLTVAAVADCFVLTFRAIAAASRFEWTKLVCDGRGVVDRPDGIMRFTGIHLNAQLTLPPGADTEKARKLLEKAEKHCLVGNSLKFEPTLDVDIKFDERILAPTA